ncbi:MAG: multifunctional oxoglutarate decarboxylase/oxoglutarate dehydrogenase thiamine pyrophosphate-binding subunit/dihydrolipoyllysine-residue succinyltransferase subunit, partial [Armatimonadetes bacterium]|nr:multifunctional oxoglutarate decarboxylase/oxoglutarate dehydrogenase thiamine pyrophosphate-binding subunit/dihydrolipoyllysine-residue succinyltransferase subunit [Armatimonadota bacterium]
ERPSVVDLYGKQLIGEGVLGGEEFASMRASMRARLDRAYQESLSGNSRFEADIPLAVSEEELREFQPAGDTRVSLSVLTEIGSALTTLPEGFRLHPKLKPFFARRRELLHGDTEIDWAYAEALAFGTLVYEGTPVRLSGQDCARGTFSQRHLVLCDYETGEEHVPLEHVHPEQARFEVFDSSLSEAAVLGFEFGFSVADPLSLVIWEAQFGDFANGAQVIIDNFISSSDSKWRQPCDLVMLLPHGFEGQGPEHSSARLERFLALCAEDNMRVCFPSSAAQYFHLLRRQMRDAKRIPLVVMTPKSTLRHPRTASRVKDFVEGSFELVIDDAAVENRDAVRRLLLCSGKVYYDLLAERERRKSPHIAVARLEQLYPYPEWHVTKLLESYKRAQEIFWVQEEPCNMGAWSFVRPRLEAILPFGKGLRYVGRPDSSSPATGSLRAHRREQANLVNAAFE